MLNEIYEVVKPTGKPSERDIRPAAPLDTLEGKRIGMIWAAFGNGDVLLDVLAGLIKKSYPTCELVAMNPGKDLKPSEYSDPSIADVAHENKIDAAIVTIGCCGTCTPGVVRAVCWLEEAGIPANGMVCTGFLNPGRSMAAMEGLKSVRLTEFPPPNILTQTKDEILANAERIFDKLIYNLTHIPDTSKIVGIKNKNNADERAIVFTGNYEEVNDYFIEEGWGDGLPIVPPTVEAMEKMLAYTDRPPGDLVVTLKPTGTQVTVWSVAVNGVMAGCKPSYMPILLAVAEAVGEERFAMKHAGSTSGWTPIIFLNGPIRSELGFNTTQGPLRPGNRANMSIGRFLHFVFRNLAGFKVGSTDLAAIGRSYLPVLPENEENSPYEPLCTDFGFDAGKNVVIVQSSGCMTFHFTTAATAEEHLELLAREALKELQGEAIQCLGAFGDEYRPVLILSPQVANILNKAGYSKQDIRDYIYKNARITEERFTLEMNRMYPGYTLQRIIDEGFLPSSYKPADYPATLLPLFHNNKELIIIVAGFEDRNRSCFLQQIAHQGLPCAKEIVLPKAWGSLPK